METTESCLTFSKSNFSVAFRSQYLAYFKDLEALQGVVKCQTRMGSGTFSKEYYFTVVLFYVNKDQIYHIESLSLVKEFFGYHLLPSLTLHEAKQPKL